MRKFIAQIGAMLLFLAGTAVNASVLYVDLNSTAPTPPYTNWATAAVTIQDAVDAASAGDQILVTNGIYQTGGRAHGGMLMNRVAVDKPMTVRSVNGPLVTIIQGYQIPGVTNGDGAVRCMYLTNGTILAGFTLTQGATMTGDDVEEGGDTSGGGILCARGTNILVSNCIIMANAAGGFGGGVDGGTYYNSLFYDNHAALGGGSYGGGTFGTTAINCTIVGNSADIGAGDSFSSLYNCIVFDNDTNGGNYGFSSLYHCCTTPDPGGIGNITNAPLFVDEANGDFHLQNSSPCINSGNNACATSAFDLDGNPRIAGGTVDLGAYEFQSPDSIISYAWLQQYKLPLDGSADFTDPDKDGMNNYQEWIAGTDPTNAQSKLVILPPAPANDGTSNLIVSWQSVNNRTYFLQCSTNLVGQPAFLTIATNLPGQDGLTSFTSAPAGSTAFYRVGAVLP